MKSFSDYTLYYSPYCPFCIRVLNAMKNLNMEVSLKDTANAEYKKQLVEGGGKQTVPCLKHPDGRWQYESADIIKFLESLVN